MSSNKIKRGVLILHIRNDIIKTIYGKERAMQRRNGGEIMMKKTTGVLVSLALILMMGLQVFAAPSIIGSLDVPHVTSSAGRARLSHVTDGMYDDKLQEQVDALNSASPEMSLKEAFGKFLKDVTPISLFDRSSKNVEEEDEDLSQYKFLTPVMDIEIEDADPSSENPVEVTFTVNNLTDDVDVYALYYCEEHQKWELIPVNRIEGNQVSVMLHATSPIALVYKDKSLSMDAEGTSPKTGESNMAGAAGMMAVVCAGFGIYAVKRSRKEA